MRAELCPDEKDRDGQRVSRPVSHIEDSHMANHPLARSPTNFPSSMSFVDGQGMTGKVNNHIFD